MSSCWFILAADAVPVSAFLALTLARTCVAFYRCRCLVSRPSVCPVLGFVPVVTAAPTILTMVQFELVLAGLAEGLKVKYEAFWLGGDSSLMAERSLD